MLHRFPPRFALLVLLTTAPAAQDQSRLVDGTVRNEAGAPISGARVRLAVCNGPFLTAVLAADLADSQLPATRSTTKGTFALVMAPVHDRLDSEIHGQLALVVEADGRQPWRELLPSPPSLYTGSDVVLPALRDADRATVKVEAAPGHAFVRLQRVEGDRYMQEGGPPNGECHDLPVPDGGVLEVHVPLIPNPPSVPCTGTFAAIGWTAQLVCPGRTSEPQAVFAGEVISFAASGGAVATQPARAANGTVHRVARCLHRLRDGSLRWFPAVDGAVTEDPRLPVVAIELADPPHQGFALPWSVPVPELPDAVPRELRCVDPAGDLVDDVRIGLFAPDALGWTFERLRPLLPAVERLAAPRGTVVLPDSVATRPSAWITAPRHLPQLVLDVRTLRDGGRIVLEPATRTVIARAQDDKGQPVAGAFAYTGPHIAMPDRMFRRDAPWLRADGSVPRTDAEGRCELPATADRPFVTFVAAGWRFDLTQYDERPGTVTAVGHAMQAWRVRAVSAAGRPVPFANLGAEIWTYEPDGSSTGHSICAMADSRGVATILAAPPKPPNVTGGQLGSYPGRGTALAASGTTDVRVADDPFVAVVSLTAAEGFSHFAMGWRGAGRVTNGRQRIPTAMLFRWPAALPLWAHEAASGPPIAVTRDEAMANTLHVIDRRKIARVTPLRLTGHVPLDLAQLRSHPAAIAGCEMDRYPNLDCEYLHPGRDRLALQTRDALEHDVWVMHPETLPARARIASGAAGRDEVTVELTRGAPCTLVVRLSAPVRAHERITLAVRKKAWFGASFEHIALHDPRLYTDAVTKGIEMPAPFALRPGTLELSLSADDMKPATVTVDGTTPVRVEFLPAK